MNTNEPEADSGDGAGAHAPLFLQSLVFFFNHFEGLQTVLFEVELIINNVTLTYVSSNTIERCLTPNHLFLADNYYILLTQHQL